MCGQLEPLDEIETPENFSKKGEHSYFVSICVCLFISNQSNSDLLYEFSDIKADEPLRVFLKLVG